MTDIMKEIDDSYNRIYEAGRKVGFLEGKLAAREEFKIELDELKKALREPSK